MTPSAARRWAGLSPAAVFLACWALYLPTLNPAFRADDSPETMAAAITLGIQHPPAYPLQSLLGRLASLLPLGAPAWRLNLSAAFFGALACAALAGLGLLLGRRYGRQRGLDEAQAQLAGALVAVIAGSTWGASATFWSQALAAKGGIYTLHQALAAGLLLLLAHWVDGLERRPAPSLAQALARPSLQGAVLLAALGVANHWETQALFLPAMLLLAGFALWPLARRPHPARGLGPSLAPLALLGAAGLAVYAYLPLRARLSPVLNWGDPRDWTQFWWVLLRQEYLDLETGFLKSLKAALFSGASWSPVGENWAVVQRQGLRVLSHAAGWKADLGLPLVLLGLPGLLVLKPGWRPLSGGLLPKMGWALLLLLLSFVGVVTFYFHLKEEMVWILDVFLLPLYMVQALLAGLGALWLLLRAPALSRQLLPWAAAALVLIPVGAFALRGPQVSQARQFLAWDFAQDLLLSAERGGIILAEGDFNTMPVYYLQRVAGQRLDVDHVTTVFLSTDWGVEQARRVQPRLGIGAVPKMVTGARAGDGQVLRAALGQVAAANLASRPLYASLFRQVLSANVPEWEPAQARPGGWSWQPQGLLVRLEPVGKPSSPAEDRRRLGLLTAYRSRHLELDRVSLDPSPSFALSNYGTAFLETALYLRGRHRLPEALPLYRRALQWTSRDNLAETWTHYGIAVGAGGDGLAPDLALSADCFRRAAQVKPLFEAYANLAGVDNQMGQKTKQASYYGEAEAAARQALALSPSNPQAWNNLAISLYYQGRTADARQTLAQAAQLAPGDPQIQANLRALGAAR